jgi:hypothetical protein
VYRVGYQPTLQIASALVLSDAWTRLDYTYRMPFSGDADQFGVWLVGPHGAERVMNDAQSYQDYLVDHLKSSMPYHEDIANIRHFGPAEWPYFEVRAGASQVLVRANPALRAGIAANPMVVTEQHLGEGPVPVTVRTFLRAHDLVRCGYPTEAVLVAIALLDATVQDALTQAMRRLGLDCEGADALLRNTATRRLATFLDPVLMLVAGHSLRVDDGALFDLVNSVNRDRNDAIHNGREVDGSSARGALLVVYDTLDYLRRVLDPSIRLPPRPIFKW